MGFDIGLHPISSDNYHWVKKTAQEVIDLAHNSQHCDMGTLTLSDDIKKMIAEKFTGDLSSSYNCAIDIFTNLLISIAQTEYKINHPGNHRLYQMVITIRRPVWSAL